MTTIGSTHPNPPPIDPTRPPPTTPPVGGAGPSDPVQHRDKRVVPPGGLSSATGAGALPLGSVSFEGIDWDALVADMATTDTMSISISDIMVLLVATMSEMRKGQRQAWMAEAQNALSMGLNAADRMRESAAAKLACDTISNGVSITTAAVSIGMQGASLAKEIAVTKAVDVQVDAAMMAQQKAAEASQSQMGNLAGRPMAEDMGPLGTQDMQSLNLGNKPSLEVNLKSGTDPSPGPGSVKLGAGTDEVYDRLAPKATDGNAPKTPPPGGNGTKSLGGHQGAAVDKEMDLKMWATQEKTRLMKPFNAKLEIASKAVEIAGSFGKVGASVGEYFAGVKQAEAQEARARGDFAANIAQVELDFANELRDTMKGALDTMKSVEASRHQAVQGIYNI